MNYAIVHEIPGRIRFSCGRGSFSRNEAGVIEYLLEAMDDVKRVQASYVTGSVLVEYGRGGRSRSAIMAALGAIDEEYLAGESLPAKFREDGIVGSGLYLLARNVVNRFLPLVLRAATNLLRFVPYLFKGVKSLLAGQLDVSVLDACAIGVSLLFGDFGTAGTIMALLTFGDILESWTRERSKKRLAEGLVSRETFLWVETGGAQVQISADELKVGDLVVVRAGAAIPVDGVVVRGDAMVNQSAMTGEPLSIHRYVGSTVYAGTALEEGELLVRTTALDTGTRISRIMQMIDESEEMKAEIQSKAERLADAIVPYSFVLAGLVFLVTRNFRKATSVLLVDYSCAIKLSTPLAILSAMREGVRHGVVAKGGRILERIAEADTVVFDKTGTLSVATPVVADVIPLAGYGRNQVLRTAACLEEHFPHSIARAVVDKASEEGLAHREEHAEVEYIVAHGIASRIGPDRVIIGSEHFVLEDEKIVPTKEDHAAIEAIPNHYSLLYLAIAGRLAGIICVEDPLRPEAAGVIKGLRREGVKRVVMLTGDSRKSASHAAALLDLDDYRSQLLPEQKTEYIRALRDKGARVVMVGDGINDSPALSAADVGISMKESADIAREISDVLLTGKDLNAVVDARSLSKRLMRRINDNYLFIVGINTLLLVSGLAGVITPAMSAILHNTSTLVASVRSLKPLLPEKKPAGEPSES